MSGSGSGLELRLWCCHHDRSHEIKPLKTRAEHLRIGRADIMTVDLDERVEVNKTKRRRAAVRDLR